LDEAEITRYISTVLPGVDVVVASREGGAAEIAWGDSFFIFDPDRNPDDVRRFPFATIVTKDYGDSLRNRRRSRDRCAPRRCRPRGNAVRSARSNRGT